MADSPDNEDLADASTARGLWQALRKLHGSSTGKVLSGPEVELVDQIASDFGVTKDQVWSGGDFDDPLNSMVQEFADECSDALSHLLGKSVNKVVAGALPLPTLHTWLLQSVSMEPVVALSHGSLTFCNLFAKAFATLFPVTVDDDNFVFDLFPDDSAQFRANKDKAASRLAELLAATVEHGNPNLAEPYLLTGPSGRLASILCRSMELFLIGRLVYLADESGHDCRPCREWSSQLGAHVLELRPTESQCVLADLYALFAMEELQARYEIPRGLACWGADLLLAGLQIAESLGKESATVSSDDPIGTVDRRMLLRKFLHDRMDTMRGSAEVLELWDWGADLLEDLSKSISVFYEQHSRRIAVGRLRLGQTSLN